MSELNEEITRCRDELQLRPIDHPERASALHSLAYSLYDRFNQEGEIADLNEALDLYKEALSLRPEGHPSREVTMSEVAVCYHARFKQLGNPSDLEQTISFQSEVLKISSEGDSTGRDFALSNMAGYLHIRYTQYGNQADLDEAFDLESSALELRPKGHPYRDCSLGNLAWFNFQRFSRLGVTSYLDEALVLEREALKLRPEGHFYRPVSLQHLAIYLRYRFKQQGISSDIDEALSFQRDALENCLPGNPNRSLFQSGIATALLSHFNLRGVLSDLDEALSLNRDSLESRPQGHPDRQFSLRGIADCLHARFKRFGALADLEEALAFQRDALQLLPQGNPSLPNLLCEMAECLHARFIQFNTLSDLDDAIALGRDALDLLPKEHTFRVVLYSSIGGFLYQRFSAAKNFSDLEEALTFARNSLELTPQGHTFRPAALINVACYLHCRYTELGTISDLDETLALVQSALELIPQSDCNRAVALSNTAFYIYTRFLRLGTSSDLDEAIALERESLSLRPEGHSDRSVSLGSLARCLHARYRLSGMQDLSDWQESFAFYSQLSGLSQTVSFRDLTWVKEWIEAAEGYKHGTTVLAYQTFLRLSAHYFATLPSLPRHLALLKSVVLSIPVDAFSACVRYENFTSAVELLEQGRGVFWTQLLRLRSPLDDVAASGPTGKELADKFSCLAASLGNALYSPSNPHSQREEAHHLQIQLQEIVSNIRELPGLSRFLEPSAFSVLRTAASRGPVIILNASRYSCDALIVLSSQDPIHITLPITRTCVCELTSELRHLLARAKLEDMSKELMLFLRGLWDVVVFPIVKVLETVCPYRSRIWWCPTAEFSLLPIHAAGSYRKKQPNLSSLYISSYTPTLTALVRAHKGKPLDASIDKPRFLLVGQANAQGKNVLESVNAELSSIAERARSAAVLTCLEDEDANIAKVSKEVNKHHLLHLACHGVPNRKHPFESGFALSDGRLKIERILRYNLHDAHFAYLSACHTTVGDESSPDEVIHLAAAMQSAGFRSVIGTMWAVDDGHANAISSRFYECMMESGRLDPTRAAWALHKTMRTVSAEIPFDQRILYVHIGV